MRKGALPHNRNQRGDSQVHQHIGEQGFQTDAHQHGILAEIRHSAVLKEDIDHLKGRKSGTEINPHSFEQRLAARRKVFQKDSERVHKDLSL